LLASPAFALAQACQLMGTITGLGNKPLVCLYTQNGVRHTDTIRVTHDQFTYVAKPSDDGTAVLYIPGAPSRVGFWAEPGKLHVQGNAAQPSQLQITGTPENNVLAEHYRTVSWPHSVLTAKTEAERAATQNAYNQETVKFIKAHPAARTSADLLYWQMLMAPTVPLARYEQLAAQLTPAVRQSPQGQQVAKRLLILQSQPTVGRPVADFTIADTAGVKHSLATYRGQYVLLDFWGHWCSPCIKSMPKVKALHQQYGPKLAIIGIGMEAKGDQAIWKKTIRKYEVPGVQLSELQGDEGPVISGYNITAFPTYMLLDPNGLLVMTTSEVDDITKKLASLGSF
jgi:thiol-disulfide isomerase/thioredoxin